MHLHILKIILWPRDVELEPRIIDFSTSAVNVLTGQSETGKSAVLSIVDYCLGSGKCTIPVGRIRNKTEWFGLHIRLSDIELLVGRKEPGEHQQTSEALLVEAGEIGEYPRPETNCSIEDLKSRLNEAAGLSGLDFNEQNGESGFRGRASFRDMAAFNFLPQHVVANPHTLFFKADTYQHQEKLRTIFPLVLGSIDNSTLIRRRELRELEREREKLDRELEARDRALATWIGDLRTRYLRAIELGLLTDAPDSAPDWSPERYTMYLRRAIQNSRDFLPKIEIGSTDRVLREIAKLNEKEAELAREIGFRRHKQRQLQQLNQSAGELGGAIDSQHDRLAGVGWFVERLDNASEACPMCGSAAEAHKSRLRELRRVAEELRRSSSAVIDSGSLIDKELADLRMELRQLEQQLNEQRTQRAQLEASDKQIRAQRQRLQEVYRFTGSLEQAVTNVDAASGDDGLPQRRQEIMANIRRLKTTIGPKLEARRRSAYLDRISRGMTKHLQRLGVAEAETPVRLDITNLTLRIIGEDAREDFLWEIGSAANWMGYHIAAFLALHEHFLSINSSPVPSFLFIDQPSQAFFPDKWPGDPQSDKDKSNAPPQPDSDDIVRVRQIFDALSTAFIDLESQLQIIVVDHAGQITWKGLPINMVERWRDGNALIPESWLT